jgi:hypothetical protein
LRIGGCPLIDVLLSVSVVSFSEFQFLTINR